jgi:hypothetical protein
MEIKAKMETKNLKRMLEAASAISDETTFRFGEGGVEFRQMDGSQIAIVCASIPASLFGDYSVAVQTSTDSGVAPKDLHLLCINSAKLCKVLDNFGDVIEMSVPSGGNRFNFSSVVAGAKKRFSVPLVSVAEGGLGKMPQLTPAVIIEMDTAVIKQIFKDISNMTEATHISWTVENGIFTVAAEGDNNNADVKFDKESPAMKNITGGADQITKSVFPLDILSSLFGAIKSQTIVLQLSTNKPIIIKDTEWDVQAFLAPRVEQD